MSATNNTDEISEENISKVFPEQHVQEDIDAGIDILAMGCSDETCHFQPVKLKRRCVAEEDILIEMYVFRKIITTYKCAPTY
jgi:hypothetical protein